MISNGHGEDAIAARLAAGLGRALPWIELAALPLVGVGSAYRAAPVTLVGPAKELPSGGLTLHHFRLLAADLRAGLLSLTAAQAAFLRRVRPLAVLVVGDAYAQAHAQLVRAPRRVLQPLVSQHQSVELDGSPVSATALNRFFMERIRAPELWLMRRADKVYARDPATAAMLRARGVRGAEALGNPVMDGLEAEPLVDPAAFDLVVALLPGSRRYSVQSVRLMAEALLAAARRTANGSAARGPLLGLVAWTLPLALTPPPGWRAHEAADGEATVWRRDDDAAVELRFVRGRFAAVLASASVAIGTAGTANEQAAGRGLPVVAFPVPPDYSAAFLANQERLLGGAVRVVPARAEAVGEAVLAAGPGSTHRTTAASMGPRRMGAPGGSAALVADLAGWLERLRLGDR